MLEVWYCFLVIVVKGLMTLPFQQCFNHIVEPGNTEQGEVSEHEWVPIFPVFNQLLVTWKKYYVFEEMTLSSRYSCIACNNQYA